MKVNHIEDLRLIDFLYQTSTEGVDKELTSVLCLFLLFLLNITPIPARSGLYNVACHISASLFPILAGGGDK